MTFRAHIGNEATMSAGSDDSLLLEPGHNCWRTAQASRLSVIVDAEDYFRTARAAMLRAEKQIMLIGWDFDARILLTHDDPPDHPEAPREVGAFITWLVRRKPELNVHILRWDVGAIASILRGRTLQTLIKWKLAKRIHLKLDATHPTGASHHQKIVVIDDCLAFCGGIDMTLGRWDTRAHADDDPGRTNPGGDRYMPWHDATTAIQGPAAAMLGDLCRERWHRAGGHRLDRPQVEHECWPDKLTPDFTDIRVAVARTQPELNGEAPVQEIEKLYLDLIGTARRFIYAESQYFASRRIAEALAKRLAEPDGPEFVIVNPRRADGWLEQSAMDTARARLFQALKQHDPHGRLRIYHPYTAAGEAIYVHAKVLVVDDRFLRIGSSNFNNRSLGLDTECDVALAAGTPEEAARIAAIRDGLLAEHLGTDSLTVAAAIADKGSLVAAVEGMRGTGRSLRPYEVPDLSAVEEWLAENQILDAGDESPMEAMTKGGLLRRLGRKR